MAAPVRLDITLRRGTDQLIDLTATDDGTATGTPTDITGWTFELTIVRDRNDLTTAVLLTKAGSIVDAVNGEYRYTLTDDELLALAATKAKAWYDSRRTNAGAEWVLTEGDVEVRNTAGGRT